MERDRGFRAYQHQPVIPEPTQEELDQRRDDFIKLRVSRTESNLRYWLYLDKNKQYFEQKLYL